MKRKTTYSLKVSCIATFIFLLGILPAARANVFVVFYATYKGKTGHAGIAVDRYDIFVRDIMKDNIEYSVNDTLSTGNLIYFDLWPKGDAFIRGHLKKELEPCYYQLPRASTDQKITVHSLLAKGLPHKEFQPVDGLIEIETCPFQDNALVSFLEALSAQNKCFNAQLFNCTDFVCEALKKLTSKKFSAKEVVLFARFSTPNKLFKKLTNTPLFATHIVKHPGKEIEGSFFIQKIIPELKTRIRQKKTTELL